MPKENEFLYLARITPSKGLVEYIEAARLVKKKYPSVKFHVVGPIDNAVEPSINNYLDSAVADGSILYHGKTDDVQGWLSKSRFFIYPSYYPEGVPRCVLQALSCGRPIITCDSPGCKKTVVDGVNGFLTKPRDYMEIAKKIVVLLKDPILAENMGKESRKLAEEKFDIGIINKKTISLAHGEKC